MKPNFPNCNQLDFRLLFSIITPEMLAIKKKAPHSKLKNNTKKKKIKNNDETFRTFKGIIPKSQQHTEEDNTITRQIGSDNIPFTLNRNRLPFTILLIRTPKKRPMIAPNKLCI